MNDDIGDRFKRYESCFDYTLPRRLPMVVRVDGRAFHGLKLDKPFDHTFHSRMCLAAWALCQNIQGAVLAFIQSDEISVVARDDMRNTTQPWVNKRLSKVVSLSAAIATAAFNDGAPKEWGARQFDARAFVLPDMNEVINYLIWRQQDATRNSISMAAHTYFSHKSLQGVNSNDLLDRLRDFGKPWEATATHFKHGTVCKPVLLERLVPWTGQMCERREWLIDYDAPVFSANRAYIETLYLQPEAALI